MNILSTLKMLPLLGIVATSITLSPGLVYAENNHRMQQNDTRHERIANDNRHADSHRHGHNEGYRHNEAKRHKRKEHRIAHSHDWRVKHNHRHDGHRHYVDSYIRDYGNSYLLQHYLQTNQLRFMLGIHSDNFDIVIRD
ncbi:MAG: hypothetical protein OEY61_08820 [Gammaproteobacteria bacterium]|nr:hypothetical protein [Gammaproteobacteria bacterium]